MKEVAKFIKITWNNHLNRYCLPTRPRTIDWIVELEDGSIVTGHEEQCGEKTADSKTC